MATEHEKEQIIERTAGREYTRASIAPDAIALWRGLDQARRRKIDDMEANRRIFSFQAPSRFSSTRARAGGRAELQYYNNEWQASRLRNTARNSYVNARFSRIPGGQEERTPAERAIKIEESNIEVKQSDAVQNILQTRFETRVVESNLGALQTEDQKNRLRRTLIFFPTQASETPTTPAGILYLANTNFRWAYYTLFAENGIEPSEDSLFEFINFDNIVDIFLRSRVNEILHESIDELPEEEQDALLADPDDAASQQAAAAAEELLRLEAVRTARERYIPGGDLGSQENQSRLRRLAEQAFLVDFLPEFAEQNQKVRAPTYLSPQDGAPYFSMIHGRTDTVVNRLVHDPALQELDRLRPSELAGLVPKIRLFKVFPDSDSALQSTETDNNQKTYIEQEIPFDNYIQPSEIESMMSNTFDRGRGVGLKSFDWRLEGRDPFTSRRDIFAELKLYFQSFDEILRVRRLATSDIKDKARPFRYVDLVNIGVVRQTREGAWNPDYYKLRVEVGWQDPGSENSFLGTRQEQERKRNAVLNSKMVMYLSAMDHTIDVNDQGNVTMNISYVAWQEASYLDQDSDVLATDELKDLRLQRRAAIDRARKQCDEEEVDKIIEEFKRNIRRERLNSYQKLLRRLKEEQRIFFAPVPVADLETYISFGETGANVRGINDLFNNGPNTFDISDIDFSNVADQASGPLANILGINIGNIEEDSVLRTIQDITYDPTARNFNLQYFYFGDLIKVAIEQASTSTPPRAGQDPSAGMVGKLQKDLRILLGPISFKRTLKPAREDLPAQTDFVYNINLADIPISVNFFGEWLLKQVVSEQRNTYPILVFIRDLANKMLSGILRNQAHSLGNVARQNLQLRSNFFSAAAASSGIDIVQDSFNVVPFDPNYRAALSRRNDPSINWQQTEESPQTFTRLDVDGIPLSLRPLLRPPNTDERAYNYMLVYAINTGATERLRGNFEADNERGIYHFGIGRDRGIFKSVSFSKTDLPFLREGRFEARDAEAAATGLTILANVYEIEVKMFGNTMFAPGMKIFLNPSGIAPMLGSPAEPYSPANLLGIGGYHVVTGVRSYIEGGKFETTMKAIFEASGARGALGFSGAEQTAGREERCPEGIEARSISDSPTPVDEIINTGPRGND